MYTLFESAILSDLSGAFLGSAADEVRPCQCAVPARGGDVATVATPIFSG